MMTLYVLHYDGQMCKTSFTVPYNTCDFIAKYRCGIAHQLGCFNSHLYEVLKSQMRKKLISLV